MSVPVVVDASVTLQWLFDADVSNESAVRHLLEYEIVVPWLWRLEVVNAVLVQERRKRLTRVQTFGCFRFLNGLNATVIADPVDRRLEDLAELARPHQLTAYDAVYVELAMRMELPLLTYDRNQRAAAARLGLTIVE